MKHLGLTLSTLALMVVFIAATQDVRAQKDDPDKKAAPKKGEGKPDAEPAANGQEAAANIKKIIERLHENMDASEDKLGKKDTSEETRRIQDQILKDLDELIKQQNQGDGGGGGGGGASSNSGGKGSKGGQDGGGASGKSGGGSSANKGGGKNRKNGGKGDSKNDPQNAKGNGNKENPMGKGPKDDKLAKGDPKGESKDKGSKGTGAGDPSKKGGEGGGGLGGKGKDGENTVSDMFRDIWGHLPQKKRDEMDAYSKERFLQKYEPLLRQYYRTISEQGRKKEGE